MEGRGKSVHWLKHYCVLTYFIYIIAGLERKTANNVFTPVQLNDSEKNTYLNETKPNKTQECLSDF